MVAERARDNASESEHPSSGWLTLPQAACELGVSVSTVRRLLRKGQLPARTVPRRGGVTYLVYLPLPRHGRGGHSHLCSIDDTGAESAASAAILVEREAEIHRLELQIERLSQALAGRLRVKQRRIPGRPGRLESAAADDPYARYRWLLRRHRWWPF
jgi:excisionase family DNA binding protein